MQNARACAAAHPDWRDAVPYWLLLQERGITAVLLAQLTESEPVDHESGSAAGGAGAVVGLIEIAQSPGQSAVIRNLDVLEAYRGRGIGAALITAARRYAREHPALAAHGEIRLAVLEGNPRAAALYRRLSFTPTGLVEQAEDGPVTWMAGALD